jgi:phosphoesterase RecJ-like protein
MNDSQSLKAMYDALRKAERVLVIGDGKPDGDSIGSSTALYDWLKHEGKDVALFMSVPVPKSFFFLDHANDFTMDAGLFDKEWDVVVSLDASEPSAGGFDSYFDRSRGTACRAPTGSEPMFINVDHHVTNIKFGHLNVVMPDACSTCEIVYRFFEKNHLKINDRIATSLLTGLCTDTSHFTNAATNTMGLDAAAACTAHGARHADILRHLVQNKTVPALKLWGLALERLAHDPELDGTVTYFTRKDLDDIPGADEAVEGVSNFLNATCGGSDTFMVLCEKRDGTVKASLRSLTRDVSEIAKTHGGGGHKKAAGFSVKGRIDVKNGQVMIVPA